MLYLGSQSFESFKFSTSYLPVLYSTAMHFLEGFKIIWLVNPFIIKVIVWLSNPFESYLACLIRNSVADLCRKTHEQNILLALLPNTAALKSSIGFTVMNYQAIPKANQMSVPTSNKFQWPSHIFSLLYRFNRLIALLFFWFPKPSTSAGLHDPSELCCVTGAPCNGMFGHQWPCTAALPGSKHHKEGAPRQTRLVFLRMKYELTLNSMFIVKVLNLWLQLSLNPR